MPQGVSRRRFIGASAAAVGASVGGRLVPFAGASRAAPARRAARQAGDARRRAREARGRAAGS